VPYPFAGAHQAENARILSQKGAALILDDKNMSPVFINGLLDIFLDDNIRRKTMSAIASSIYGSSQNLKLEEVLAL
jgi:UDP-N-acetylglucosamine:LPS N-acetylglucosamine transferase